MKILVHMCCAPCACYPIQYLRKEHLEPVGYFFNPNIHPCQEFKRRLNTVRQFAEKVGLELFADNHYRLREFLAKAQGLVQEQDSIQFPDGFHKRCEVCYSWRLNETAHFAAQNNFELFTSTLFYSKYQNHELMKKIAEQAAKKYGVRFFYQDWRDFWQAGIDLSLELGLYRQNYCGCLFSEEERFSNAIRKQRKKFFKGELKNG